MPLPAVAQGSIDLASVLIGVALVVVALAVAWVLRRRTPPPSFDDAPPLPLPLPPPRSPVIAVVRSARRITGAGLEVVTSGMVCPTCRTEYPGMLYCQRDARRLVPAEEMLTGRPAGGMCTRCGRAFEPGIRRCPHDGAELVPPSAYHATRRPEPPPTGVLAKVCPVCRHRYDLTARFCGRDGHDLVVVN
ncbi:MAG: zinc ribbon domain-containing protein [Myxococcales bacterium]|nr:zinc ribbon domain-containing protein [Myxococcales bacterium]